MTISAEQDLLDSKAKTGTTFRAVSAYFELDFDLNFRNSTDQFVSVYACNHVNFCTDLTTSYCYPFFASCVSDYREPHTGLTVLNTKPVTVLSLPLLLEWCRKHWWYYSNQQQ